jgi:exonuclease VII small subunit
MADNQVDLKLNLDFQGVNDALYQMIGQFNGTDKEFQKIAKNIQKNAKNLEAAIKLFGPASQQAGAAANKLQKDFQSLVANGIDPASASFKKMTASMPTAAGLDATTGSLRKNNMQWSNLALVIQDLPFGFRGIQNNLPAVAGGFAKMTGPIYLGISALIAVITAWDMGMFKAKKTTDELKQSQDDLNKALSNAKNDYYANELLLTNYVKIARDANSTDTQRKNAIDEINKVLKDYGIKLDENTIKTGKSEEAIKKVTEAMLNQALIAAYKEDYVALVKLLDKEKELASQAKKTAKSSENIAKDGVLNYQSLSKEIDVTSLATKTYTNEADRQWMNQEQVVLNAATAVEKVKSKILELQKVAVAGLLPGTGDGDKPKPEPKPVVSKVYENLAQEEFNFYKDSIFRAEEYFTKLNNIQKINALMEATIRGASFDELLAIQQTYEQKELNFRKSIEDRKFAIRQESEERQKQLTKFYDDQKIKDQVTYTTNYIATLDAQLKAQMRLNRNNVALQQEDVKNKLKQLQFAQVFAAGNVKALDAINAAILKLKGNLTGLGDVTTTVNNILTTGLQDTFVGIGESLGELVTTGKFSFGILGNILADALIGIGKALILYSSLVQAAKKAIEAGQVKAGLIIGIAAVAAGFALKGQINKKRDTGGPKAFADGGIISGPTLGLMGEYPGAANNPEVVAPLDKLKSLIGGGGGTLEARISGNDLLILMNKAGRTNNNTF